MNENAGGIMTEGPRLNRPGEPTASMNSSVEPSPVALKVCWAAEAPANSRLSTTVRSPSATVLESTAT